LLLAEDEYLIADDMRRSLEYAGAQVIGPAATVAEALTLIESHPDLDGAAIEIRLGADLSYAVADALSARGIPYLFATAYEPSYVPGRFQSVPRCDKPLDAYQIARLLGLLPVR